MHHSMPSLVLFADKERKEWIESERSNYKSIPYNFAKYDELCFSVHVV